MSSQPPVDHDVDAPLVFLHAEAVGDEFYDPLWEVGVIRRDPGGVEQEHHLLVSHDQAAADKSMPEQSRVGYQARYRPEDALHPAAAGALLEALMKPGRDGQPVRLIGTRPGFDTYRVQYQLSLPPWNRQFTSLEDVMVGFASARGITLPQPWDLDVLAEAIGIDLSECCGPGPRSALDAVRCYRKVFDTILCGSCCCCPN